METLFDTKGLHELDEVDVLTYLQNTSASIMKNRKILIDNNIDRKYRSEILETQYKEITKFKSIIKELNNRITNNEL